MSKTLIIFSAWQGQGRRGGSGCLRLTSWPTAKYEYVPQAPMKKKIEEKFQEPGGKNSKPNKSICCDLVWLLGCPVSWNIILDCCTDRPNQLLHFNKIKLPFNLDCQCRPPMRPLLFLFLQIESTPLNPDASQGCGLLRLGGKPITTEHQLKEKEE